MTEVSKAPAVDEREFYEIADFAPVIIWRCGLDKRCDWVNRLWLEFTGRSVEQELGFGWLDNVHADDKERCFKAYSEAFDRREPFTVEFRILSHGDYRWLLNKGAPYEREGRFAGYFGSCTDVTEQRLQSQRLKRESETVRELFQQTPNFIALTYGAEHRIEFANHAFEHLVGRGDLIGKTVGEALPELQEQGFVSLLDGVYATGKVRVGREVALMLHRGDALDEAYVDLVYQPIKDGGGEVTGILIAGTDVTEQKRGRDELSLVQTNLIHMSRVSAMGAMASTLAHELNQPLTAISNYLAGCQRLLDSGGAEALDQLDLGLENARKNALRAGDIIRSLRDMTVRGDSQVAPIDASEVIDEALTLALVGAHETGIDCKVELEPGLIIKADRVQIQQIVLNLVRNAIDAMQGCPRRELLITASRSGGDALIRIDDSGVGLPEELRSTLFQPFVSTKEEGMGVGLSISRTIIEAHGGQIWAEPNPQGGASFHVLLPLAKAL